MEFMIDNPEERRRMGERALGAAQSEYNFDRMAERLVEVYERLQH